MGNCFEACGADFEGTVGMVASARSLAPEEVRAMLATMRARCASDEEYRRLRRRLPESFPL